MLFVLLAVVATSAAVLSFSALRGLGEACGFGDLAWLLPLVIDAGAAAGTVSWLAGGTSEAQTQGRRLAVLLLAASVAGNAVAHVLEAYRFQPAWWLVVAVSALAPAVLGAVVHLAVGTTRDRSATTEAPATTPAVDHRYDDATALVDEPGEAVDPVVELIADGAGRRRLAKHFDISEYAAQKLLDTYRSTAPTNGHEVRP